MNHQQLQQHIITIVLAALLLVGCGNPVVMTETSSPVATTKTKIPVVMTETKTPPPTMTWLGMQYPPDKWQAETVEDNPLFHGLLTHLTLPGCQVMVLAYAPEYLVDFLPVEPNTKLYGAKTILETTTNGLKVNLVTYEHGANNRLVYYEVRYNKAGLSYFDSFLGYFLFSQSSNVEACRKAFLDILVTLQIEQWPRFQVIPGPAG